MADNIIEVDTRKQYMEDMQKYGLYTLFERYLPNIYDGLKPVQRRILDAMYFDIHCNSRADKCKSANVVGRVMGEYHPHGNCLRASTNVYLANKVITTISYLFKSNKTSFKALGVNPETLEVEEVEVHDLRIGQYTDTIYHIGLSNGAYLECTANHPIMLKNGDYLKAEDIKPNMELFSHRLDDEENSIRVTDVYTIATSDEPMYDFTVDSTNNMLIPVMNDSDTLNSRTIDEIGFICVHNSGIYDAMKPMINWFETPIPILGKQGNFGTFQGDPAAAMRYTETFISKFGIECVLGEITESKKVVDWVKTFDNRKIEPETLPTKVPLLLINGVFAIALGIKVEIPHYNINEVIDCTIKLLHNPNAQAILIPDECMPCDIIDTDWKSISNKGFGYYKVRGRIETIKDKAGNYSLSIRSVPDLVFSNTIKQNIEKLIADNKLIQVADIQELSDEDNLDLRIVLKKGADPEYVKQVIYSSTSLEINKRVNIYVIDGIEPKRVSIKAYLINFIEYRRNIKFRLYNFRLQKVNTRLHELETYIKILKSGDVESIIHAIRNQKSMEEAVLIEWLMNKLKITDLQAKFILNTEIKKLSKGNLNKYEEEAKSLQVAANNYINIILHPELIDQELEAELLDIKNRYGYPRRCNIISESEASNIPSGEFKVVVTEQNYLKKMEVNTVIKSYKGDEAKYITIADNAKDLLVFDEMGKVYSLPVHKIPFTEKNSTGTDVRLVLKNLTSNICTIMYKPIVEELANKRAKYFIVVVTNNGMIKKMDLNDIINATASGLIYSKLNKNDLVKDCIITNSKSDIVIYSKSKALRLNINDIPYLKRSTLGNKSMNSKTGVDGMVAIAPNATDLVVCTAKGVFNRFSISGLPMGNRNTTGTSVIKLTRGDYIQGIFSCTPDNIINVVSGDGILEVLVKDIPVGSSISAGNKMCKSGIIKAELIR